MVHTFSGKYLWLYLKVQPAHLAKRWINTIGRTDIRMMPCKTCLCEAIMLLVFMSWICIMPKISMTKIERYEALRKTRRISATELEEGDESELRDLASWCVAILQISGG